MKKIRGVYLIKFENGLKIGMSNDIIQRLEMYKSPWMKKILKIWYVECQNPKIVETKIKEDYKKFIKSPKSSEFLTDIHEEEIIRSMEFYKKSHYKGMIQHRSYKNKKVVEFSLEKTKEIPIVNAEHHNDIYWK